MARLLAAGYDELLLDKLTTGSGTGEPRGVVTALDANTNQELAVTTDQFGDIDVYALWEKLPQKYRRRAAFMCSVSVMDHIRAMGDQTKWHAQTVQLPAGSLDMLFGRGVYENSYMEPWTGTTGHCNLVICGDLTSYVVAARAGVTIETVPHLFGPGGRPTGQRGLFVFARVGGNVVNDAGLVMVQNT
jgi:HK97 family phage major capsid protein